MYQLTTILSIAGTDPTGAGIQADIKAASLCGVFCLSVVTAVTAQNSKGVSLVSPVVPFVLERQLEAVMQEHNPRALKIGMFGSTENAVLVKNFISKVPKHIPVIIDPVMKASAGGNLFNSHGNTYSVDSGLRDNIWREIYSSFLGEENVILTPNIPEAQFILGDNTDSNPETLARRILSHYEKSKFIIVKGGHCNSDNVSDCLAHKKREEIETFLVTREKIESKNLHGTGCMFASLFSSHLALEKDFNEETVKRSFLSSCEQIHEIINNSKSYSFGLSSYGPLYLSSISSRE